MSIPITNYSFSAYAVGDLFAAAPTIGTVFSPNDFPTQLVTVQDDDTQLKGNVLIGGSPFIDTTEQTASITRFGIEQGNLGVVALEGVWQLLGSDGKTYKLAEVVQDGGDSVFTFAGALPEAGLSLVITGFQDRFGIAYDKLDAGELIQAPETDGSNDVDFIYAGDLADTISTGKDNDWVAGNGGADDITLGAGNDFALGGTDDDTLNGGIGNDTLHGGADNDYLSGAGGLDSLFGEGGDDTLRGGDDADVLVGGVGDDSAVGGNGADLFIFNSFDGNDTWRVDDNDTLDLNGTTITSFFDLDITKINDNRSIIDLGAEGSITVLGANGDLDVTDFNFVGDIIV